jgi:phosphoglycolate phosphatase-like HAD superfamily hydrolase
VTDGREIDGVVFDLDGTLYDKRPVERWVMTRMLPSLPRLWRYTRVRTSLAGVDLDDAAALARETLQRLASDAPGQAAWQRWISGRYEPTVLRAVAQAGRAYPGAQGLLVRLRAAGLRLGLVSDYRGAEDRLRALGIDPALFHFTLVTEEHGAMKPAKRMAARTLEGMGLPGARMVMVGDRAFADQRFAEACGMRFCGVLAGGDPPDPAWLPWEGVRARLSSLVR